MIIFIVENCGYKLKAKAGAITRYIKSEENSRVLVNNVARPRTMYIVCSMVYRILNKTMLIILTVLLCLLCRTAREILKPGLWQPQGP